MKVKRKFQGGERVQPLIGEPWVFSEVVVITTQTFSYYSRTSSLALKRSKTKRLLTSVSLIKCEVLEWYTKDL